MIQTQTVKKTRFQTAYRKARNWLKIPEEDFSLKLCWVLIAVAYVFSVAFRILLANYTSIANLKTNGEFINTPDGYYFAKGALDLLQFGKEQTFSSPTSSLLARLTAFLAQTLPLSFETVVFFMPVFLSSFLVIPLILIGRSIRQTTMGLIAALTASVAYGYYARTLAGYFDTDMLNIVLPTFIIYFIIAAIISQKKFYLALITVTVAIYQCWYPQAYSLNTTLFLGMIMYGIVFDTKNIFNYQVSIFLLLGILALSPTTKIILAICFCSFFYYKPLYFSQIFWYLFAAIFLYFIATTAVNPIVSQLKHYLVRGLEGTPSSPSWYFYNVISTVREAKSNFLQYFIHSVSGHYITFILSCLGYGLASIVYRPLLLMLPMVGLGFFSFFGGIRFAMYAIPAIAFGLGYVVVSVTRKIHPFLFRYIAILIITSSVFGYNYTKVKSYKPKDAFGKDEILVLRHVANFIKPTDYVFSWWDYGHALRYFTGAHSFIDGNRHGGDYNLPVAFVLTEANLTAAAHMLRIATEYDSWNFTHSNKALGYIESYMLKNRSKDPNSFFTAIADEKYPLPQKSRDVYLVTSYHMLILLGSIQFFSNIDLLTGKQKHFAFYVATKNLKKNNDELILDNKYHVNTKTGTVHWDTHNQFKLKSIVVAEYQNERLVVNKFLSHSDGLLNLVLLRDYNAVILVDNKIINSAFFKLFVLEENDPRYFEPIAITGRIKIYKLKI